MEKVDYKTRKVTEEYTNKKGQIKTRTINETYTETNTYYYHKNHLNSIVAITDNLGNILEEYEYDVFGKPYSKDILTGKVTNLKASAIGNTRLFTGREYDRGLKLYYNRARYYNPQLGRFISRDPIDISDDVNLYAYVGNNGVMFVDRMGLSKDIVINNNLLEKFYLYGATNLAGLGINALSLFNNDIYYGALEYNLAVGGNVSSLTYNNSTDYVNKFKSTETYENVLNNITNEYYNTYSNTIIGSSDSFDNFSLFSIGKFDYKAEITEEGKNLNIDIQITDVYNFDLNFKADNVFDQAINMLYFSQNEGYINEYDIIINLNQKIKGK